MRCNPFVSRLPAFVLVASVAGFLAGCEESGLSPLSRSYSPIPPQTVALMEANGSSKNSPVLIRAYKKEAEFEIWKMNADGRYAYLKTFPMCRWSGQLGPKVREGDRQVPEGFYSITPARMNPNSAYYLSFDVGYPNNYDRALGHSGGSIMVHGICSSAGCFSMTNEQIAEIYAIAREGFAGGQHAIQMQSYPFRMTAENLAKYRLDPNIDFWNQLKEGADNFEVTKQEVDVGVCNKHYVFNAVPGDGSHFDATGACPPLKRNDETQAEVAAKQKRDEAKIAEFVAQGVRPVHTVYVDGGQHPNFASLASTASRPEALAQAPVDVALDEAKPKTSRFTSTAKPGVIKTAAKPASSAKPVQTASMAQTAKSNEASPLDRKSVEARAETRPLAASGETAASAKAAKRNEASSANGKPRDANAKPKDAKPQNAVAAPAPVKPQASASPASPEPVAQAVAFLKAGISAVTPSDH
jgi:murein L,D-transpeptidase YafK